MRIHGSAAISDLLGEFVVYRSLRPADPRLPGLAEIRPGVPPRKGEPAYAWVVSEMLQAARRISRPGARIERVIMVGDTQRSDGGAFDTICSATGWRGRAFICNEEPGAAPRIHQKGSTVYANAWQALHAFHAALEAEEFRIDAGTVVVIDIDKTLIGAKGRNHQLIDKARLVALRMAVAEALGAGFDQRLFETIYHELDQSRYHGLTEDNQDNVAYLCVMVGGGVLSADEPARLLDDGHTFRDALDLAGDRVLAAAPTLAPFHDEIVRLVLSGDPTPFKAFRRREYHETIARMGCGTSTSPEALLAEEITITAEIWELAREWERRGALLFGLSDKPDEAAVPDRAEARAGAQPLHRITTHIVGV
jgi:hypothetical protein